MQTNYVAYFRVSTQQQGRSGLGLAAQKVAVDGFLSSRNGQLLAQFAEVESGKLNERPQLQEALALCRKANAVLLIAKLDRLSRSAGFLLNLRVTDHFKTSQSGSNQNQPP
jgi:DNA invertase Pin-like site-specific DNA recombinase